MVDFAALVPGHPCTWEGRRLSRIQHLVLFRFPNELSEEEEQEFFARVRSWPEAIDAPFVRLRIGPDISGRSQGHQYALLTEFDSEEDMRRYQAHPVHQEFLVLLRDRDCDVLAFDYALGPATVIAGD